LLNLQQEDGNPDDKVALTGLFRKEKMNIEAFLLCDCATNEHGKLNVLGAFDTICSSQMPATHPACTIAARIRFSKIEEGEHKIRINVIDEDGNSVGPELENSLSIRFSQNQDSSISNFILNIQGLKLEKFGEYRVDLALDGRQEASVPLFVKHVPNES